MRRILQWKNFRNFAYIFNFHLNKIDQQIPNTINEIIQDFEKLKIKLNEKYKDIISKIDLSELCIVSKTQINFDEGSDILVETKKALGDKCPVCWKISVEPCERHSQ